MSTKSSVMRNTRASTFKVEPGYVWCDKHGCIHDDTLDPYEMGGDDVCQPSDHRPVYVKEVK